MIRKFTEKDLPQVLNLCREIRQYHIDLLNGYFTEQNDEFEKAAFLESLRNDKIIALVAEDNDKIVGYILRELKELAYLVNPKIAHISNFGVSEKKRNKGFGKKLMDHFLKLCENQGINEVRLGVYNQNISAYKFYENYGFIPLEQKMILNLTKK